MPEKEIVLSFAGNPNSPLFFPLHIHLDTTLFCASLFAHVISCTYCLSTGSFPPHCLR